MILAKKLRETNIAEYLLYMWQVEDIIRAHSLDIDKIEEQIINQYDQSDAAKAEISDWYEGLIEMMRREGVVEQGHLIINQNVIMELTELHRQLLKNPQETEYNAAYYKTLPFIVELRAKSTNKELPEIETCFSALYGFLLMRLQQKEISGETQAAITQISSFLRSLAMKYQVSKEEGLDI